MSVFRRGDRGDDFGAPQQASNRRRRFSFGLSEAVRIAKEFTKLNLQTKEYLLARLQMITEEEKGNNE